MRNISEQHILEVMKTVGQQLSYNGVNMNNRLIRAVYQILTAYFIQDKKTVILQAPTGSGKSVIGFYVAQCVQRLIELDNDDIDYAYFIYYLTVSKILQEQVARDIDNFNLSCTSVLKGRNNYLCKYLADRLRKEHPDVSDAMLMDTCNYDYRPCANLSPEQISMSKYSVCAGMCPYTVARFDASRSATAVLNYSYFLTVLNAAFNPYFGKRYLTICDEAHKIPQVVDAMFTQDITAYTINRAISMIESYTHIFDASFRNSTRLLFAEVREELFCTDYSYLMNDSKPDTNDLLKSLDLYIELIDTISEYISKITRNIDDPDNATEEQSQLMMLSSDLESQKVSVGRVIEIVRERPRDFYIQSTNVNGEIYKHQIKDLNETRALNTYFMQKTDRTLFMSATMGKIEEFCQLFSIKDPVIIRLESDFDFSKSPILAMNAGSLVNRCYEDNINNVLVETIKICHQKHPDEKGIIHTHTKDITDRLMGLIYKLKSNDKFKELGERFLFYGSSAEKEECIKLMSESETPYIICGPSLVEGVDLKDDMSRFNILIKVPYPPLTTYARKKMERCSFWYERATKESIVQAIGRSNRNKNDYSTVYLMDSKFMDIIFDMDEEIVNRVQI